MPDLPLVADLMPVFVAYLLAVASPGPSTLAIMAAGMAHGRAKAVAMALGVVTGSLIWAALAAGGLAGLLTAWAGAVQAIRIAGGVYLLYLALRAARSALRPTAPGPMTVAPMRAITLYRRGLLLHLANPKAILGWVAIMSLGLRPDAPPAVLATILCGCAVLGLTVNLGYAVVFSTARMARAHAAARRWIDAGLALVFGLAGLRLLLARA